MVKDKHLEQAAKKTFQKRESNHFFTYYYVNKKEKFVNKETRELGIFHTFFSLEKNFLTGKESREPWCFFSPTIEREKNNFRK